MARTVSHLPPRQIAHRIRLRSQRVVLHRWPAPAERLLKGPRIGATTGWPASFGPVDAGTPQLWPDYDMMQRGEIELLGVRRKLGEPMDWQQRSAPQLWRYHLHYWDWAWGLMACDDRVAARALFARLWRSWGAATPYGYGDAWSPYVVSVRAWSMCGVHSGLVAGSDLQGHYVDRLSAQAGFLRRHLELDVGGNHVVKNLKALIGLGVFFGDDALITSALRRLVRQLRVQVLGDGGHFERAPAYHCQVLGDLIDIAGLLHAAGLPSAGQLDGAIGRMRDFLGNVLTPDGTVPLLNDGYPVAPAFLAALQPGQAPSVPVARAPDSGLVRATCGGWWLLADVGAPCPDELPAHAHADTFGFLLYVDGRPLLIDTATSTYEAGATRARERSTAAHNTVQIDGRDSTEVWAAFRAGRRARVSKVTVSESAGEIMVSAEHDGYRVLRGRPVHKRGWSLTPAGLSVVDTVTGGGVHEVVIRWHLAPGSKLDVGRSGATVSAESGRLVFSVAGSGRLSVEEQPVAQGYRHTMQASVLVYRARGELPVRITSTWRRTSGQEVAA